MYTVDHDTLFERQAGTPADVTVCISLFNYQDYVIETLESVRQQTLSPISLIVVDDCSTDAGPQRVHAWLKQHSERFNRAVLVRHRHNSGGPSGARNTAIALADSDYVFLLDADNLLFPRCLQALTEVLEASDAAFAYPMLARFGDKPGLLGRDIWDPALLSRSNYIDTLSLLKTGILREVGGFSQMEHYGWEDYELWLKIAEAGYYGLLVPQILAQYRAHTGSISQHIRESDQKREQLRQEITRLHPWVNIRQ